MPVCGDCGGTVIEYDVAAGNGFCVKCGTVIEENTIVSEVTFGETSSGAAMVQGAYVGQGSTHAKMSGPFGNRGSSESREQTIANAGKKIRNVATVMKLSETICLAATRLYTLAVEHKFTKGRKNMNVIAVCLYVACRQKDTRKYMLIDFSDLLQVNVFELGHTYLQLVHTLNLRLPLVDPSHYISRFASLLEFGPETSKVATDAIRLVSRFDRDWMTKGRRPAGICGACLLLAARMNNFRRSIQEIVQVVKIADTTVKKRLEEFRRTPSGKLTVADFRTVWLEEEMDPPAFTEGKEREAKALEAEAGGDGETGSGKGKGKKRKKKRKRGEEEFEEVEGLNEAETRTPENQTLPFSPTTKRRIDPSLLNRGILRGTSTDEPLFLPSAEDEDDYYYDDAIEEDRIDPSLLRLSQDQLQTQFQSQVTLFNPTNNMPFKLKPASDSFPSSDPHFDFEEDVGTDATATANADATANPDPDVDANEEGVEAQADAVIAAEVGSYLLSTTQGSSLSSALDEAETRRLAELAEKQARRLLQGQQKDTSLNSNGNLEGTENPNRNLNGDEAQPLDPALDADMEMRYETMAHEDDDEERDELAGLDEDELDAFLLTEDEVRIKERVWVEINKDYLEALAARAQRAEMGDTATKSRKRRKPNKPRDHTTPSGSTPAEAVRNLIKRNHKYSKRINYDALKDIFGESDSDPLKGNGAKLLTMSKSPTPALLGSRGSRERDVSMGLDKTDEWYAYDDDKSDGEGEGMVVIEEEGGGTAATASATGSSKRSKSRSRSAAVGSPLVVGVGANTNSTIESVVGPLGDEDAVGEDDVDGEGEDEEEVEDGAIGVSVDYGWDEGYEQEV